ncbi:MAG: ABC transporter six-transmembrane domain-containing protein, partial [Bacteroidota bacterium]
MKIFQLIRAFKWSFALTFFLILAEAALEVLFPLFIGFAIDGAIAGDYNGPIQLMILGLLSLFIMAGRRFFDSRFYAKVFKQEGLRVAARNDLSPSKRTARLNMLREMVEFFENSVPMLVMSLVGLAGTLLIIATLNQKIFWSCLATLGVIIIVYLITSKRTFRLNKAYNDEAERQVDSLSTDSIPTVKRHLQDLMKWNIKLSDLETINFSITWVMLMGLLVMSIVWAVEGGINKYG